jgi:hypothetical protein
MSIIVGLDGRPIAETVGSQSNRGKITKSQASAIIISEIDIAIENWNKNAMEQNLADKSQAPLFKLDFNQYPFAKEVQEAQGMYGFAQVVLTLSHRGQEHKVYRREIKCKTKRDLENVNGYMPDASIDLSNFLLQAGLMYVLAMKDLQEGTYETEEKLQPKADSKSKPGSGSKRKSGS